MKQENDVVLADMLLCAAGWHVDACLIGNVTAGQIRAFCLSVSDYKARIAELEVALKLAMDWLEDEVPKYVVDELINSLR